MAKIGFAAVAQYVKSGLITKCQCDLPGIRGFYVLLDLVRIQWLPYSDGDVATVC